MELGTKFLSADNNVLSLFLNQSDEAVMKLTNDKTLAEVGILACTELVVFIQKEPHFQFLRTQVMRCASERVKTRIDCRE